jgi:hypothetical protein
MGRAQVDGRKLEGETIAFVRELLTGAVFRPEAGPLHVRWCRSRTDSASASGA